MKVIFYKFAKSRNELKIPSTGTEKEVSLKEDTSVLNPSLIVSSNLADYNYFYIPSFKRYYFVTDYQYLGNNTFAVSGKVDSMGSWRDSILNSRQYIDRAATGYDDSILDTMFPSKAGKKQNYISGSEVLSAIENFNVASFVIGVIGSRSGASSIPVTYWVLSVPEMKQLNEFLFNSDSYGEMVSDDIVKAFFNPMDYIISCVYFPYMINTEHMEKNVIELAWFRTDITASKIEDFSDTFLSVKLPVKERLKYNDYRNSAPWSEYRLWLLDKYYELEAERVMEIDELSIDFTNDLVTGVCMIEVGYKNGTLLRTTSQLGCPIAMAQLRQDWVSVITSGVGALGSAVTGNFVGAANGIASAIDAISPKPTVRETNGGLGGAFWNKNVSLTQYYYETTSLDANRIGRPVCREDIIKNYSGYTICKKVEIELNGGYDSETEEITSMMEGGFYVN